MKHVAFICFPFIFLIRSHIASIWDGGKLVLGRHFNTRFYNIILPLLVLIFCDIKEKVPLCVCLQVVVIVYRS